MSSWTRPGSESSRRAASSTSNGEQAGGELHVERGALSKTASLDADAVRRAIANLVENALRHSGSTDVTLAARVEAGELLLEVADRGRGIPATRHEEVFRPFERLEDADDTSGGTGLGLAIVREIARAHGGDTEVADVVGGGARLVMRLPLNSVTSR